MSMRNFEILPAEGRTNQSSVDIPLDLEVSAEQKEEERLQKEELLAEKIAEHEVLIVQYDLMFAAYEKARKFSVDIPLGNGIPSYEMKTAVENLATDLRRAHIFEILTPSKLRAEAERMFKIGTAAFDEGMKTVEIYRKRTEEDLKKLRAQYDSLTALEDPVKRQIRLETEQARKEVLSPYFKRNKDLSKTLRQMKPMPKVVGSSEEEKLVEE